MSREDTLLAMYQAMLDDLGPSSWWPASTDFEVMVGAMLTQNTNWDNAAKAIDNLRQHDLLSPEALYFLDEEILASYIRSAGYFRLKARRLKNLLIFLHDSCRFDLSALKAKHGPIELRQMLLDVKGIGPETADSILLYALQIPFFVVDAYTHRILNRHFLVPLEFNYDDLQDFFMEVLPYDNNLFNEFHALLVRVGKKWCLKKEAKCSGCPLQLFLTV